MNIERDIVLAEVRRAVSDAAAFRKLVLTGDRRKRKDAGEKTVLEPVNVHGEREYRLVSAAEGGEETRVVPPERLDDALTALLDTPFRHLHVLTASGETHVRVSKKGRYLMSRGKGRQRERIEISDLDRSKPRLIDERNSRDLLLALGMLSSSGAVKAGIYPKFRQVNRFIELISALPAMTGDRPVRILDCGCGRAYLTFALHHYLRMKGRDVSVVGVDQNDALIKECLKLRDRLGCDGLEFYASPVASYQSDEKPDLVLSLHACDLATDEAIAKGVNLAAAAIVAVPCCQHELHEAMENEVMRPILRHGILRERAADILTDALRALVLRVVGYKADVMEFIDPDATAKNVMIRAQMARVPSGAGYARELRALCAFWGVRPKILDMLDERFRKMFAMD